MIKAMLIFAFAITLSACANTETHQFHANTLTTFKPGVTTVADVEAAFGEPVNIVKSPDGTTQLQYMAKAESDKSANDQIPGELLKRNSTKLTATMLSFDQSGHFVRSWSN